MTEKEYRSSLAVGGTDARLMVKDFEAWSFERRLKLTGTLPPWMIDEPTDAMLFGTATHLAILEPQKFKACLVRVPYGTSFATKEGKAIKAQFEEFREINPDALLLKEDKVWAIEEIVRNFREAVPTWDEHEVRLSGTYEGHALKGTADALTASTLIDIKTTRDIKRCAETIAWEAYHVQLAHYDFMLPKERHQIVFLENQAPFRVRVVELSTEQMQAAKVAWKLAIDKAIEEGLMVKV